MNQSAHQKDSAARHPTSQETSRAHLPRGARAKLALFLATALGLAGITTVQAQTNYWTGAGSDQNWSSGANWTNGVPPLPTDNVYFMSYGPAGTSGASGNPNSIVDSNTTIQSLWYTNNPTGGFNTTLINPGVTLTVTGALANALFVGTLADVAGLPSVYATINGPGATLLITNTTGTISVRQGEVTSTSSATLDLRGLDTLQAYVSQVLPAGENIGKNAATMYFAKTNFITCYASGTTAGLIVANNNSSGSKTARAYLGVTNVIFSDGGMEVPQKRMTASLAFNAAGSAAYFRNRAGTGRQDHWNIGYNNTTGTGTGCSGSADFSAGTVDAMVNTIIVGSGENTSASGGGASGVLNFYGGTIDVNTLTIGQDPAAGPAVITGTVNVHSDNAPAQLIVNGNLRMAMFPGGAAVNGTLNVLNNAVVTVKGSIIGGNGNNLINVQNSTFNMGSSMGGAGTGQGPINTFQLYSSTMTIDMGISPNPVAAVCTVTNLDLEGSSTLNLLASALAVGQFHLFTYQNLVSGGAEVFTTFNLPSQIQGFLSNNVAASSIDLVITNVVAPVWNGLPNGNWDINATANWMTPAGAPLTYHQATVPGDLVTFDDRAHGTTTVNLTTTLSPASINVNNTTKSYTYTGTGQLSGSAGLAKNGANTLTVANSGTNNFTGPVTIGGGTLQLGVANGLPTNSAVTLADAAGAALDLHNMNQMIGTLSGGGANGGNVSLGTASLSIAGTGGNYAAVISGSGRVVVTNSGSQVLSGANLYSGGTLVSTGTLAVANSAGSATGTGWIDIEGGTLQIGNGVAGGSVAAGIITNNGQLLFNSANDLTFTNIITGAGSVTKSGAGLLTLPVANTYTGQTTIAQGPLLITDPNALGATDSLVLIPGDAAARLELQGNITVLKPISMNSKGGALNGNNPALENLTGTNTLAGSIQAASSGTDLVIQSDDGKLILSGSFAYGGASSRQQVQLRGAGDGEFHGSIPNANTGTVNVAVIKRDAGTWRFTGSSTNTYTDTTSIQGGTLIVDGSIQSTNSVTVSPTATLGGSGFIAGPVALSSATLSPGNAGIGTLTINNTLTFDDSSVAMFDLSKTGGVTANDRVAGLTSVTYAGTLQLTLAGTVTGGEVFKLFSAGSYSGTFGVINLPPDPLPSPFIWDTDLLAVDGTVRVDTGIAIASASRMADGNFQIKGNAVVALGGQAYRVLATTNLSAPLSSWVQVDSGTFAGGPFTFTDLNVTNHPTRFYRILSP